VNHYGGTAEALEIGVHLDQMFMFIIEPNLKRSIQSSSNFAAHDNGGSILTASATKDGSEALLKSGCQPYTGVRLGRVGPIWTVRSASDLFVFNFLPTCAWMSSSGEAE
jgi:hypothetical protein